jgi:hypothetical protein
VLGIQIMTAIVLRGQERRRFLSNGGPEVGKTTMNEGCRQWW